MRDRDIGVAVVGRRGLAGVGRFQRIAAFHRHAQRATEDRRDRVIHNDRLGAIGKVPAVVGYPVDPGDLAWATAHAIRCRSTGRTSTSSRTGRWPSRPPPGRPPGRHRPPARPRRTGPRSAGQVIRRFQRIRHRDRLQPTRGVAALVGGGPDAQDGPGETATVADHIAVADSGGAAAVGGGGHTGHIRARVAGAFEH